ERIKIRAAAFGDFPAKGKGRHRCQLVEKSVLMLGDSGWFADIYRRWFGLARYGGEVSFDQRARFGHIEIACNGQHGVVGCVINAKKLAYVFDRGRVQVFHRSDGRMRISMIAKTHFEQAE